MAFKCRICKNKFLVTTTFAEELGSTIVSSLCGHLFHKNCLEASVTNQKLSHAMTGTGPFKRYCPSSFCGAEIAENGIIEISTSYPQSPNSEEDISDDTSNDDLEIKLMKKFQILTAEKDRLTVALEKSEKENENYREAIDEIKAECEDMSSLLIDDDLIKRGDRVFWITKEGTFAPGRILEMRKTSNSVNGSNSPYAIIKLERKTKLPGQGPERETAIVPVNELLTFKSFFKEFFQEFRHKLWKILLEANEIMSTDERQKLLRSKLRESCLRLSIDSLSASGRTDNNYMMAPVNSIPVDTLNAYRSEQESSKRSTKISRAKTMHSGTVRPRPRIVQEKSRSISWHKTSPLSEDSEPLSEKFESDSSIIVQSEQSPVFTIGQTDDDGFDQSSTDYITVGERVIWYDINSQSPQVGEVVSVLQYTPCAIVKFDKLPNATQIYQFRTAPLVQLFPYALACHEEKFRIAEAYDKIDEFMNNHPEIFENDAFDKEIGPLGFDDEEYFSTSSAEDIITTLHEV